MKVHRPPKKCPLQKPFGLLSVRKVDGEWRGAGYLSEGQLLHCCLRCIPRHFACSAARPGRCPRIRTQVLCKSFKRSCTQDQKCGKGMRCCNAGMWSHHAHSVLLGPVLSALGCVKSFVQDVTCFDGIIPFMYFPRKTRCHSSCVECSVAHERQKIWSPHMTLNLTFSFVSDICLKHAMSDVCLSYLGCERKCVAAVPNLSEYQLVLKNLWSRVLHLG